eukprot:SAG25_NODE_164_length_13142_cov_11.645787_13_plen_123_part_00
MWGPVTGTERPTSASAATRLPPPSTSLTPATHALQARARSGQGGTHQEEVKPIVVEPDENKPGEQEVLERSSVSAKPEGKPWEFAVCLDVDQFGKPVRGLEENDIQFDYMMSLYQRYRSEEL